MKLNLGCGFNHISSDYVCVDKEPSAKPDVLHNLEVFPWPWKDSSINEVMLNHSLEHIGELTETYKRVIQELYRICVNQAAIIIRAPFFRHDNAISDPTHCRAITPLGLSLLSRKNNEEWIKIGAANSPLALYWNVNFEIKWVRAMSDEAMWKHVFPGIPQNDLSHQSKLWEYSYVNNLISEVHFELTAIK